jgi:hypothetical protein
MQITEEVVAQLKEANPKAELHKLSTPTPWGEVVEGVVRVPTRAEWKMSRELIASNDPAKKVQAAQRLFEACVLYPSGTQRDQLVATRPGIVDVWAGEIGELAGVMQGTRVEKL